MPNSGGTTVEAPNTLQALLRWGAERWPERPFVALPDGVVWTRGQALQEAARAAVALQRQGIGAGARVVVMLDNGADWLRAWWGLALIGAVLVPINPSLRGTLLADFLDRVEASWAIADDGLGDEIGARRPQTRLLARRALADGPLGAEVIGTLVAPADLHVIVFSSGTTGASKASLTSNYHVARQSEWMMAGASVGPDDVLLVDLPLFHMAALGGVALMLRTGGRIALRSKPALSSYWEVARETGATFAYLVGSMGGMLRAKPPSDKDRDHGMRFMLASPIPADPHAFIARFGLQGLVSGYGSTETSTAAITTLSDDIGRGSLGRPRPGFDIRVVDVEDCDVPEGSPGEMIIRSREPLAMSLGYCGDAEATARAWRGGWFHTGDLVRRGEDGYLFWLDRTKDSLRRRGENISSQEVERELLSHSLVAEVACVAAPSEYGDDEVKVFIVPSPQGQPDLPGLLRYLAGRMPYFMVPRYFEFIDELPKTPTAKVQKFMLRERGHGSGCWDREAHGLRIERDGSVQVINQAIARND